MRSSLRKLRVMGLQRSELREKREQKPRAKLGELVQAVQVLENTYRLCFVRVYSSDRVG